MVESTVNLNSTRSLSPPESQLPSRTEAISPSGTVLSLPRVRGSVSVLE